MNYSDIAAERFVGLTVSSIKKAMDEKGYFKAVGICPDCMKDVANFLFENYSTAVIEIYGTGGVFGFSCHTKEALEKEK